MSSYNFPFKSYDFDVIYTNIAETLKVKYPQNGDSLQVWYKKLLYELMSYVQSEFEPEIIGEIIPPKNKNNKRKNQNQDIAQEELLFADAINRSLEIIYQDSNFAIYLLSWFLPILVSLTDTFEIDINIDNSDTPAENVILKHINLFIEQGMFKITILINNIDITNLTENEYQSFLNDPFLSSILKALSFFKTGYVDSKVDSNTINYDGSDPQIWSFRLSRFMYDIKNILTAFYIDNIQFKTNLEPEITTVLSKNKNNKNKNNRRRFNEQKYITSETVTENQMTSQIIRSLIVSTFRTYYDFDEETMSAELFDYLFRNKPLSY